MNLSRSASLSLLGFSALLAAHAASAAPLGDVAYNTIACVRDFITAHLVHSFPGADVHFVVKDKAAARAVFDLHLNRQLGAGLGGSVYEISSADGLPAVEEVLRAHPDGVVVKFPLSVKYSGGKLVFPHASMLQNQEAAIYKRLYEQLPKIEADPAFPKDPYWGKGRLPDAPIIDTVKSDKGLLIFKQKIQGRSLAELETTYRGQLPPEMQQSLRDVYDLAQAMYGQTKMPGRFPLDPRTRDFGRSFWPDLNPSNLVWVDGPTEMQKLGFKRPGFALYEWGELLTPRYRADNMPFEGYLAEVTKGMAEAAAPPAVLGRLDAHGQAYRIEAGRSLKPAQADAFATFLDDVTRGGRELALDPRGAVALFKETTALYTGKFAFSEATPVDAFLKSFWTPKTGIVGALEDGGRIRVFTDAGKAKTIAEALPKEFRGKPVEVVETSRSSSIIDPDWYKKNADRFYTDKPVVLVTGTTAGIGLELVRALQSQGYRVVATGRPASLARLAEAGITESDNLIIRPLDVADEASQDRLLKEVTEKWGGVDMLVNNAGIASRGSVEQMTKDELQNVLNVNFIGPRELTRKVLPLLRLKGRGKVIFTSSTMGEVSPATLGGYAASKHAIEATGEALYHELRGFGVDVTLVEPGYVNSGAADKILRTKQAEAALKDPHDPYHRAYVDMEHLTEQGMKVTPATSKSVADDIARVIKDDHPPLRYRDTLDAKFFHWFRMLPQKTQNLLMKIGGMDPDEWRAP